MRTMVLFTALVILVPAFVSSQTIIPDTKGAFGFKLGVIDGTTVKYERKLEPKFKSKIDTEASLAFGVFFEQNLYRKIRGQFSIDVLDLLGDPGSENEQLLEFSLGPIFRIRSDDGRFEMRTGTSIGHARLAKVFLFKDSDYMILNTQLEVALYSLKRAGLIFEFRSFWTLSGGDREYDVSGGPIYVFRFGVIM